MVFLIRTRQAANDSVCVGLCGDLLYKIKVEFERAMKILDTLGALQENIFCNIVQSLYSKQHTSLQIE